MGNEKKRDYTVLGMIKFLPGRFSEVSDAKVKPPNARTESIPPHVSNVDFPPIDQDLILVSFASSHSRARARNSLPTILIASPFRATWKMVPDSADAVTNIPSAVSAMSLRRATLPSPVGNNKGVKANPKCDVNWPCGGYSDELRARRAGIGRAALRINNYHRS